jgi:hypothetical protein
MPLNGIEQTESEKTRIQISSLDSYLGSEPVDMKIAAIVPNTITVSDSADLPDFNGDYDATAGVYYQQGSPTFTLEKNGSDYELKQAGVAVFRKAQSAGLDTSGGAWENIPGGSYQVPTVTSLTGEFDQVFQATAQQVAGAMKSLRVYDYTGDKTLPSFFCNVGDPYTASYAAFGYNTQSDPNINPDFGGGGMAIMVGTATDPVTLRMYQQYSGTLAFGFCITDGSFSAPLVGISWDAAGMITAPAIASKLDFSEGASVKTVEGDTFYAHTSGGNLIWNTTP